MHTQIIEIKIVLSDLSTIRIFWKIVFGFFFRRMFES